MPLIQFTTNSEAAADELTSEASALAARVLGKPQSYVMVTSHKANLTMGGSASPACCVQVSQIGPFKGSARSELAAQLTELVGTHLGVPPERTFVVFTEKPASEWAMSGQLFG